MKKPPVKNILVKQTIDGCSGSPWFSPCRKCKTYPEFASHWAPLETETNQSLCCNDTREKWILTPFSSPVLPNHTQGPSKTTKTTHHHPSPLPFFLNIHASLKVHTRFSLVVKLKRVDWNVVTKTVQCVGCRCGVHSWHYGLSTWNNGCLVKKKGFSLSEFCLWIWNFSRFVLDGYKELLPGETT